MSKGPDTQTTTSAAQVPGYLQPFLNESANYSRDALNNLGDLLSQQNATVTPFNELQLQGQQQALDFANGQIPQDMMKYMSEVADTSDAVGVFATASELLNSPVGMHEMTQFSQNSGMNPNSNLGDFSRTSGQNQSAVNTLTGLSSSPFQLNQTSQNTLQDTAEGKYLYGNPAFDEAVQASVRAARPSILSGFAGAGGGAINGGLAQTAIQQAASDAFARQFMNERGLMQGAAGQLGDFQLQGRGQQLNAANSLNNASLTDRGQQLQASTALDSNFLRDRAQQQQAAQSTINAKQHAGTVLANAANQERARGVQAIGDLGSVGLLSSNILGNVGGAQQLQNEREKLGNIGQYQTLLDSAFGNISPTALLGQTNTEPLHRNRGAGALGGAMQGFQLGSSLGGPMGGAFGAIGGGLLGAFG